MPFKSQAQKAKFESMVAEGKMSQETFNKWQSETPDKLPERLNNSAKKIKKVKKI